MTVFIRATYQKTITHSSFIPSQFSTMLRAVGRLKPSHLLTSPFRFPLFHSSFYFEFLFRVNRYFYTSKADPSRRYLNCTSINVSACFSFPRTITRSCSSVVGSIPGDVDCEDTINVDFLPEAEIPSSLVDVYGFVISGRRILTNAHVVADHTFVLVRKHGSPNKYRAEIQAIGHECDLAILKVESEEFWDGMNSLALGDIPFLQEAVVVVGYPQGGGNISVTKGVVSRVEPTPYVHGATQLLAIQIDAAINPGNSGGPAIMGDTVVGVAFQNLPGAENMGYIIPVPVIKHFIDGVEESGKYAGFCYMGVTCQHTENSQLRKHFGMHPEMTGVLVNKIHPLSEASKVLKKDDIILSFDGVRIANDGTVPFRNRERIIFEHLVSMKKPNETVVIKILRDSEELEFKIRLHPLQPLVPPHQFDKLPSYFTFAGLVFIPLSHPYLREYGDDWYNSSPRHLCELAIRERRKTSGQQLVVLSQVLLDDINTGYERLADLQVKKVNGVAVENLKHLRQLVEDCDTESIRFDLDDEKVIVLNYELAKEASFRILKRHRIPYALSSDLVDEQSDAVDELACSG